MHVSKRIGRVDTDCTRRCHAIWLDRMTHAAEVLMFRVSLYSMIRYAHVRNYYQAHALWHRRTKIKLLSVNYILLFLCASMCTREIIDRCPDILSYPSDLPTSAYCACARQYCMRFLIFSYYFLVLVIIEPNSKIKAHFTMISELCSKKSLSK